MPSAAAQGPSSQPPGGCRINHRCGLPSMRYALPMLAQAVGRRRRCRVGDGGCAARGLVWRPFPPRKSFAVEGIATTAFTPPEPVVNDRLVRFYPELYDPDALPVLLSYPPEPEPPPARLSPEGGVSIGSAGTAAIVCAQCGTGRPGTPTAGSNSRPRRCCRPGFTAGWTTTSGSGRRLPRQRLMTDVVAYWPARRSA